MQSQSELYLAVYDRTLEHPSSLIRELGVQVIKVGSAPENLSRSADILLRILSDNK